MYWHCTECGYIFEDRQKAENHLRYDVTGEHTETDNPEEMLEKLD